MPRWRPQGFSASSIKKTDNRAIPLRNESTDIDEFPPSFSCRLWKPTQRGLEERPKCPTQNFHILPTRKWSIGCTRGIIYRCPDDRQCPVCAPGSARHRLAPTFSRESLSNLQNDLVGTLGKLAGNPWGHCGPSARTVCTCIAPWCRQSL